MIDHCMRAGLGWNELQGFLPALIDAGLIERLPHPAAELPAGVESDYRE